MESAAKCSRSADCRCRFSSAQKEKTFLNMCSLLTRTLAKVDKSLLIKGSIARLHPSNGESVGMCSIRIQRRTWQILLEAVVPAGPLRAADITDSRR